MYFVINLILKKKTYLSRFVNYSPLTLSENLAKIAQKIDFSKTNGEEIKKDELEGGEKGEEDAKDPASFQSSLWPWDSVRNKLRFVVINKIYIDKKKKITGWLELS